MWACSRRTAGEFLSQIALFAISTSLNAARMDARERLLHVSLVSRDDCRRALHATVIRYIDPAPHVHTQNSLQP